VLGVTLACKPIDRSRNELVSRFVQYVEGDML
jgi:hypothetical protein